MSLRRLLARLPRPSLSAVLVAIVSGALIHIAATLAVPYLARGSAPKVLGRDLSVNEMRVLPLAVPSTQAFAFMAPDMRYAVCRYSLDDGVLEVKAHLPEQGWSLTLYTDLGDSFYTVVAPEQRATDIAFQIQQSQKSIWSFLSSSRSVAIDTSLVISPELKGLLVIRAPVRGQAYSAAVEATLARSTCRLKAR